MDPNLNKKEKIRELLLKNNQEHLFENIDSLSEYDLSKYLNEIGSIDFDQIKELHNFYKSKKEKVKEIFEDNISELDLNFNKNDFTTEERENYISIGKIAIKQNEISLLILAGGQGSRLGFEKPKGMYNIKMPSNKSIFQYLIERSIKIHKICETEENFSYILIMTSLENDSDTKSYFEENNYFGYCKEKIIFFTQDVIPAIDLSGKIIRKSKTEIFKNPNGNGGCIIALKTNNILDRIKDAKYIQVISIDNPLSKPFDPIFIGLVLDNNVDMAAKTISKRNASEPVGVFLKLNNIPYMLDYGDMPIENREELKNGKLKYNSANILNYLISVDLMKSILLNKEKYSNLVKEFHSAEKSIESYNSSINAVEKIQGIKFELFINSVFQYCRTEFLLFSVVREEEFAPVKNSETQSQSDNPKTARDLMSNLFKKWISNAEGILNQKDERILFEISFLKSYDGEGLDSFKNKEIADSYID